MVMRALERAVFVVARHPLGWALECNGEIFESGADKEEIKAHANKRARAAQDAGRPCQVRIVGENGYFG